MKKQKVIKFQQNVFNYAWKHYKSEFTMDEMRKHLAVSLATFFRRIKNYEIEKYEKDKTT